MKTTSYEKGSLALALIAGFAVSGSFSVVFSGVVPFSIFPLLCLGLAFYCLYQRYAQHEMAPGLPGLMAGCFVLGLLLYSAVIRAKYPAIGSNFLPALLSVIVVFWLGLKLRARQHQPSEDDINE